MRTHEFIADGTLYRLSVSDQGPVAGGFDRVAPYEAARLLREWAAQGLAATVHALSELVGRSPTELDWELSHPTPSVALFRDAWVHPAADTAPRHVIDLLTLVDEPEPSPPDPLDHWIEVRLLDQADRAIVGERYELALPGGQTKTGRTDDLGIVRVDRIFNRGNCEIYFPDLDARVATG